MSRHRDGRAALRADLGPAPERTLDLGTEPVIHHRHHTVVHRVTVDGRPVVVKRARGRARVTLRTEAAVLPHLPDRLAAPLVSLRDTDDHTDLVLGDVGDFDLGAAERLDARSLRRMLADTVRLVEQLHHSEWIHGALCAEHVVVGRDGRPVLCSVGSARPAERREIDDERRQVVSLVAGALRRHAASEQPARERSSTRTLLERVRRMEHASSPVDSSDLLDLLESGPEQTAERRWPTLRRLPVGAVTATVALCGLAAVLVWSHTPVERSAAPHSGVQPLTSATETSPPSSVDEPTRRVAGHIVERGDEQFSVGRAGDRVVLGDWECHGVITPAVLRPRTGEVHVFDHWAEPDAPAIARPLGVHPGATGLSVDDDDCGRLRLLDADGTLRAVSTFARDQEHEQEQRRP